jgi:hypothetical protein
MLSKSQYVRGLRCHKSLWYIKNKPELRQIASEDMALIETGYSVGDLACNLFPGGIGIEFDKEDFQVMVSKTAELIESGADVLYEATFKENGIFAMADILVRDGDAWNIYEVKASTKVKEYHLNDAAVQWYAISNAINVNKAHIVHLNKHYVREGELNVNQLFHIEDITEDVLERQVEIPQRIDDMEQMLKTEEPDVKIGVHCNSPFSCDFKKQCWQEVPSHSVFKLYRLDKEKQFEWYHQGIRTYEDAIHKKRLNRIQTIQVQTVQTGLPILNKEVIKGFIQGLSYPLYFFDFETFMEAIPRFNGQKPYMQMPFQYSLHVLHENGELEHCEYLGDENSDPRLELVIRMLNELGTEGSIIAYYQNFEISRIEELARDFPGFAKELSALIPRFSDLIVPFRKLGYYHPNFHGSFSIKSVLPSMFPNDPELDYKKLAIQHGGMAMDTFANLHRLQDSTKRESIRQDLLAYCHLDTLAMVRIYQKLLDLIKVA